MLVVFCQKCLSKIAQFLAQFYPPPPRLNSKFLWVYSNKFYLPLSLLNSADQHMG